MPVMTVGTGRALIPTGIKYNDKVLATGPIAYWPLWETSGVVAECLVNPAQNGTYSSDVSGWPVGVGIGDGNTAPGFDGVNDAIDINTAALQAALNANTAEGSMMIWAKFVPAAWTDAAWHVSCRFRDSVNDYFTIAKSNANNTLYYSWTGGAVTETHSQAGIVDTAWMLLTMTRSEAADEVKYYRNTSLLATDTIIGNWASAGVWDNMVLGANAFALINSPFWGSLAHAAVFGRALGLPEITSFCEV